MKIGPVDGNVEEIRDLLENNGLNLSDFLEKPEPPLRLNFIVIPAMIFAFVLLVLVIFGNSLPKVAVTLFYLMAFASGTWLTGSIQIRFKNGFATFCVAVGALLMLLVAAGIFSLEDTANFVKGFKNG